MATTGNPVLVANATKGSITVGATTVASGKAALCTPTDCAAGTLGAGLTKGTPVTTITVSALTEALAAGTVIDISQTDSAGVLHTDQAVMTAGAASAATSVTVASYTPSFSFTTAATYTSSSIGQVAGAVELGACVLSSFASDNVNSIDSPAQQAEKAARFGESMVRALLSAGSDTFGVKGL